MFRTIRSQLILSGAISIVFIAILAGVGIYSVRYVQESLEDNGKGAVALRNHLLADMMHDALRADVFAGLIAAKAGRPADIAKAAQDAVEHAKELSERMNQNIELQANLSPEIAAAIRGVLPSLQRYSAVAKKVFEELVTDPVAAERRIPDFIVQFSELERGLAELRVQIESQLTKTEKSADAHVRSSFLAVVLASTAALGLSITFGMLLFRRITHPLALLSKAIQSVRDGGGLGALANIQSKDEIGDMGFEVNGLLQAQISAREQADEERKKAEDENERLNNSVISILQAVNLLSQRDLTARAPVTQDIIGTVSDSINALTDETSRVLSGVSLIAAQVAAASGKVKSQGDLVSKTAEDERVNVGRMISSLTESTQTTNQMATLAAQSNQSAEQATTATDNALETVNGTVKGMESIRETIAETEKRIKRLGERAQEITGIVSLINTISERTHVLALNASMQAAVAGEAGRGFAVVAEEVQRLAESSRNATQQIGTLVSNIQLETNETINTVNRTIDQVVKGSEQAQKAGKEMRRTQEVTAQLVSQVKRIAEGSELQKEMSANLLASVHAMGKSNERTAAQIGTQNVETESLQASARRLVESVNVFKLPQAA